VLLFFTNIVFGEADPPWLIGTKVERVVLNALVMRLHRLISCAFGH